MTAAELSFRPVAPGAAEQIAVLSINRPEAANSFNDALIRALVAHLRHLVGRRDCRAVVLRGKGKHFSAGADLAWMKASSELSYEGNIADATGLISLFEALAHLPIPTIALVNGAAFGGAVGLAACCDVVIAAETARFCLSEVKLGLMPAVILPYLARKMQPGQLRRQALSGRIFSAKEAYEYGLVQRLAGDGEAEAALRDELNALLAGAPEAQAALKELFHRVVSDSLKQGPHTAEAIAGLRTSASGQAGLGAFFEKKTAPWTKTLPDDWTLTDQ